jgi:transposase-like protein
MPRSLTRLVSSSLVSRRRWTAEDARTILDRVDASGLSLREFAAREGVDSQRLYRWRAQLRSAGHLTSPAFVEIKASAAVATIEVVLRSGHVVRVRDGFGEDTLRRLVAVLDEPDSQC